MSSNVAVADAAGAQPPQQGGHGGAQPPHLEEVHVLPEFDGYIRFDEGPHKYYVGQDEYMSTSALYGTFFEPFDAKKIIGYMMRGKNWPSSPYYGQTADQIAEGWRRNGEQASLAGKHMHAIIEQMLDGQLTDLDVAGLACTGMPELEHFLRFHDGWIVPQGLRPWRVEVKLFHRGLRVSGTVDGLFIDPATRQFVIVDWKRSKDLDKDNKYNKRALPPLHHLEGTKYVKYCLQQNVYRWLLEHADEGGFAEPHPSVRHIRPPADPGMTPARPYRVQGIYLGVMHPNNDGYQVEQLPDMQAEVEAMMAWRRGACGPPYPPAAGGAAPH